MFCTAISGHWRSPVSFQIPSHPSGKRYRATRSSPNAMPWAHRRDRRQNERQHKDSIRTAQETRYYIQTKTRITIRRFMPNPSLPFHKSQPPSQTVDLFSACAWRSRAQQTDWSGPLHLAGRLPCPWLLAKSRRCILHT
jgi:hypothetical protein